MSDKAKRPDPDLPGDENFRRAPEVIEVGGVILNVMPISVEEQQALHHNRLRYAELSKARSARANLYNESSYR